jgi:Na+/melibiose symporter-like transporter
MGENRVSKFQIGAFSLPSIPISALGLPLVVYLPAFYSQDVGLSLTLVGMIFMLVRLGDVLVDPMVGVFTDKFPARWGRRRHWLVISVPLLMISCYLLFMPLKGVGAVYLTVVLFIVYCGYSLSSITHMSWGAELSADYNERSTIQGAREFALIFGMFTVLTLPAIIENAAGGHGDGFLKMAAMGWFIIILLPVTIGIAVWAVGERAHVQPAHHIPFAEAWSIILRNKILQRMLVADLLVAIAPSITGALYIFFTAHVFGLAHSASLLLLIYFVAGFIGVPFWIKVAHKFGKHRALSIAMVYGAIVLPLVLLFPRGEFWWLFTGFTLYGLAYGAGSFLLRSVMADVTDYDNLQTGQQRTGLYFSLLSLTGKIGSALAVGITYPILDLIGFDAKGVNTPETLNQLAALYVVMPSLFMLAAAVVMWKFPLDRAAQEDIRRQLAERDGRHAEHNATEAAAALVQIGGLADNPPD